MQERVIRCTLQPGYRPSCIRQRLSFQEVRDYRSGEGIALASIGHYNGQFETIENITVRNVVCNNIKYATRLKTWTDDQVGYPPNGVDGGMGCETLHFICVYKNRR